MLPLQGVVKEMYETFRTEAFDVMDVDGRFYLYSNNAVADLQAERRRLSGL